MRDDIRMLPISEIKIGNRHRKDLGDLDALAVSIEMGLLQVIGVTPEMELIWGYRRLVATRDILKSEMIRSRIVSMVSIAQGEITENMLRKEYTPSERVAIVETMRGYGHGGDRRSVQGRNCDLERLTIKEAAKKVGFGKDDYYRAKKVVLQGIPELVEAMDSGRLSISAASELAGSPPDAQQRVLAAVKDENGWSVRGMRKSLNRAKRRLAIEQTKGRQVEAHKDDDIRLYHCPFQRLEAVAGITPESVNLILTDIPFGEGFLPQVDELGAFAARVLVPGGLLVTYTGHLYLNRIMRSLDGHLNFAWERASVWSGQGNIIHPREVTSKFKPVLVYSKGDWKKRERWYDVTQVEEKEKSWHDW